jgi:hypothetical protein
MTHRGRLLENDGGVRIAAALVVSTTNVRGILTPMRLIAAWPAFLALFGSFQKGAIQQLAN